ncbi:MAG: superoxide dismutase family protein [Acidobacteria bacterium]|nr:superoxide dismutase family protein [Acidobacteriota bacterium]MDW7983328.1 superoxide dismutase family protein [Acidobacteriota bacterium]
MWNLHFLTRPALGLVVWALGALPVEAQAPAGKAQAVAIVRGFTNSDIQGTFILTQGDGKSVRVTGEVRGLPPKSTLAIHVHEWGDCRNPDASGAHFDPHKSGKHGHPHDPVGSHHAGDLPNLETDDQGVARIDFTTQAFTLDMSPTSVIGRALIIHEKADDYKSQPAGAAGGRIACGVIGWAKP